MLLLLLGACSGGDEDRGAGSAGSADDAGAGQAGTTAADRPAGGGGEGGSAGGGRSGGGASGDRDASAGADAGGALDAGDAALLDGSHPGAGDAGSGNDSGAEPVGCAAWEVDRAEENFLELHRRAFLFGGGVVQGTLGEFVADGSYALLRVTHVWMGAEQWLGEDFALQMDEALHATVSGAAEVVVSLPNSQRRINEPFPQVDTAYPAPYWYSPSALVAAPVAAEIEPFLGYLGHKAPNVAVAHVTAVTATTVTFATDDELHGDVPITFEARWPEGTPRPAVSDTAYLVSVTNVQSGTPIRASIRDIRRDTPAARTLIADAIAAAAEPDHPYAVWRAEYDQAAEDNLRYQQSWWLRISDSVAITEIYGMATFCCQLPATTLLSHRVVEVLSGGIAESSLFQTASSGSSAEASCGNRFVFGLRSATALEAPYAELFSCTEPSAILSPMGYADVRLRLEATDDDVALARDAIASAPPLLLLHPEGQEFDPSLVDPARALGTWSGPVDPIRALRFAMALVRIEQVIEHADGYEVRLHVGLDRELFPGTAEVPARMFLPCGDARLLEEGSVWLVPVVNAQGANDAISLTTTERVARGYVFLVPGMVLPLRDDVTAAINVDEF